MDSVESSKCWCEGCPVNKSGVTLNAMLARLASTSLEEQICITKQVSGNGESENRGSAVQARIKAIQCIRDQNPKNHA